MQEGWKVKIKQKQRRENYYDCEGDESEHMKR